VCAVTPCSNHTLVGGLNLEVEGVGLAPGRLSRLLLALPPRPHKGNPLRSDSHILLGLDLVHNVHVECSLRGALQDLLVHGLKCTDTSARPWVVWSGVGKQTLAAARVCLLTL